MCLLDKISMIRKRIKDNSGTYVAAPLIGGVQDFDTWKTMVYEGKAWGSFIVIPQNLGDEISIYHSQETDNGIKVVKGIYEVKQ